MSDWSIEQIDVVTFYAYRQTHLGDIWICLN